MINLLPPEVKQSYGYARRNSALMRLISAISIGLIGVVLITATGYLYLQKTANEYLSQASATEVNLKEQNQEKIEQEVKEISSSLKLAVQVLSEEILFSKLLKQLAVITPSNVSLTGVTISDFEGALDVRAYSKDYNSATQLQVNMLNPDNKIFSKADILGINCELDPGNTPGGYPCLVTIRALFGDDSPFLFINKKVGE
jgi:hypothetical protein